MRGVGERARVAGARGRRARCFWVAVIGDVFLGRGALGRVLGRNEMGRDEPANL